MLLSIKKQDESRALMAKELFKANKDYAKRCLETKDERNIKGYSKEEILKGVVDTIQNISRFSLLLLCIL